MEKKATKSLIFGITGLAAFFIMVFVGWDFLIFKLNIYRLLPYDWVSFVGWLPVSIISALGLGFGIEGIRSQKRLRALCGILFSLIIFLIIAVLLFGSFEAR